MIGLLTLIAQVPMDCQPESFEFWSVASIYTIWYPENVLKVVARFRVTVLPEAVTELPATFNVHWLLLTEPDPGIVM